MQNVYDCERFPEPGSQRYTTLLDLLSGAVKTKFLPELGYITLKLGGEAVIFNDRGELPLIAGPTRHRLPS